MIRHCTFILLLGFSLSLCGQSVYVENGSTGEPAENVAIFNQDKSRSILTDLEGYASLDFFVPTDTLFFQHPSYVLYFASLQEILKMKKIVLERKNILIPEFVITASKHRENQRDIAYMVDVLSPKSMEVLPALNSADILSATGNIFVQKSQAGGGSPVLRGFEANKVLLVVDGVRMNNAIYRGGHLQNSLTIDNAILERAEVIYGPSSVIYGSDALGGVIHYITRNPELSDSVKKLNFGALAYTQAATASNSFKHHVDISIGGSKLASLTSYTLGNYGDIRMGSRRDPFLEDWGKCKWYVERINGVDSVLENTSPDKVLFAGFKQIDLLQKFRYKPSEKADFILNFQYSESSDINRQDQLNNLEDGMPEYAKWYYGPQKRFLSSFSSKLTAIKGVYSSFVTTVGYQNVEESRNTRGYRADTIFRQVETVDVLSLNADFIKYLHTNSSFNYGLELNQNFVHSKATKENILNQTELPTLSRYPDNGTQTLNVGAYFSYKTQVNDRLIISLGGRYQYYYLRSKYGQMFYDLPDLFEDVKLRNNSLTGAFSLVYNQAHSLSWNLILSTGFRSPNLDDLAKIRTTSGKLTLPNPDLKPENTYNAELGISKTYDGYIQINGKYFVTYLNDAIVRQSFAFSDGSDSLMFQGRYRSTFINENSSEAVLHGFHVNVVSDLNSNMSFKSTLNYTFGRDLTEGTPLPHIPPIFGKTDLKYEIKKFMAEIYFVYAGWKRIEEMAQTGEDKEDEATQYGYPGWYTINFNSSVRLTNNVSFQLAIENLTDNYYKPFASGVPAPGINFIGTLKVKL